MANPASTTELLDLVRKSGIYTADGLDRALADIDLPEDPVKSAAVLVRRGLLSHFQAKLLLSGRYRGFKLGPYVIRDQIGQGGMGTVYLADHAQLRRKVAVKVLAPQDKAHQVAVERFLREARAAAALDHPNIVRIHDVGQHGEVHFLVLEYVDGQTLDQIIDKAGPIACGRAVEYITQAAAGLQHAYEKGFVHRDIKPGNLILAKDGTVKILDMGLARSFETNDKLTEVLDAGAVVGTADYISPEQAMNAPDLDIRADIYSLGASFFTLVTGKPPFEGTTTQKLLQHQMKSAPSLATLDRTFPAGLSEVVARMLAKKPADRYATPADVINALGAWVPDSQRVVAGISRTDLSRSPGLRNTLSSVAGGSTRNLPKAAEPAARRVRPPAWLLAVGGGGLLAGLLVGVAALAGAFTPAKTDPVVKASPAPQPAPPKSNPAPPPADVVPSDPVPKMGPGAVTVYDLEPSVLGSFRAASTWAGGQATPGDTTGTVRPPTGWSAEAAGDGQVVFAADEVAGTKALGVVSAGPPAVLLSQQFGLPSGGGVVQVEYHTPKGSGPVAVRLRPLKGAAAYDIGRLPASDDGFSSQTLEVRLRGDPQGRVELVTEGKPGAAVWVRGFTVRDPVGSAERRLYQLDLRDAQPVARKGKREGDAVAFVDTKGAGRLPPGWTPRVGGGDATGEWFVDGPPGKLALGCRAVAGTAAVSWLGPEVTTATRFVGLRVLYQTDPGAALGFGWRGKDGKVVTFGTPFSSTNGEWRWANVKREVGAEPGRVELFAPAEPGAAVRVREFVVSEPPG